MFVEIVGRVAVAIVPTAHVGHLRTRHPRLHHRFRIRQIRLRPRSWLPTVQAFGDHCRMLDVDPWDVGC